MNGASRASVTFDAAGEVLSVTVTEPRFTAADKAVLLASRLSERDRRGPHGMRLSDAMDPENQFAFEAIGPEMDWAQKTLNDAVDAYKKRYPNQDLSALHFKVDWKDPSRAS